MDVKLDSLIEKIKKEGIEEAQQTSDEMIKDAKQKASSIIDEAKKNAEQIIEDGKRKVDQHQKTAESDLQQAARNAELLLKERITSLFDNVFKRKVDKELDSKFVKDLIIKIVNTWAKNSKAEIVVNDNEKKKIESLLFSELKNDLKDSISLKASNDVSNGFRIGLKGEQVYYDFSDEAFADMLKSLINPNLKEILDK